MITAMQIRAARAMLDWSREDLAEKAAVSTTALRSIEIGASEPRDSTLLRIRDVFEKSGIDFQSDGGIRPRQHEMLAFEGSEGVCRFYDLVYETILREGKGEIDACGAMEETVVRLMGDYTDIHVRRMVHVAHVMRVRHLIREGDFCAPGSRYCTYRWTARDQYEPIPFYVFNDNLAIMLLNAMPKAKIFVLRSAAVAKAFRQQFKIMWNMARPIPGIPEPEGVADFGGE
ncbi:MAG: helix-turn-helix transcriptional regulator [Alphaproteobacteria bacterium]|nr:MAG: helix-turn-helix transcriptional regulator [Alphaproteobacteria bacterium]